MQRVIQYIIYLTFCAPIFSVFAMDESSRSQASNTENIKWTQQVKERGEMLHWGSLDDYLKSRIGKKTYLVVGCGHGAFSFNSELGKVQGVHGHDRSSENQVFSHSEAFTMSAQDGLYGPKLFPDVNGFFPQDLPGADNAFDEVYFENVNGGTDQFYAGALKALKPGGLLVDDRYREGNIRLVEAKDRARENLNKAGYVDVRFEDIGVNSRNGRDDHLVIAKKPLFARVEAPEDLVQEMLSIFPTSWNGALAPAYRIRELLKDPKQWSDEQISSANAERRYRQDKKP